MTEVIGIDHIYITASNVVASERFYDRVLGVVLGFRKNEFVLSGDRHVQYFNRHFGLVLRPARFSAGHEPYAIGLHHVCFRVDSKADVQAVVEELREQGIDATECKLYSQYAPDYAATFFEDPDRIRLQITNYRQERRDRHDSWDQLSG